ncbi:MAG: CRISPR-associated endonuclease Cas1 [Gammaproteobacteria bacterium]|nr:CRISPR-associated endonuclease Cas1 [Gammaproteobacteria bacterium]
MILVIDRKDTVLRYQSGVIRIEQDNLKPRNAPIKQLEQVIVYGNPLAETSVWRMLAAANVPVAMLAVRGNQQAAMLGSGLAVQLPLRRMQHRCAGDSAARLALAGYFIRLKFAGYATALKILAETQHVETADCNAFTNQCTEATTRLQEANTVSVVMGLEGQIAHAWFALLARTLPYVWKFAGRNRQPPRDPINAMLSLGYTWLMSEIRQLVISYGFDPSLGFLHHDTPGRESLMLDVTELFRAGVDAFVLQWIKDPQINPDCFYYREAEGCRLNKQARPLFFQAWANHRQHWPRVSEHAETTDVSLKEQITGQLMKLRKQLQQQDKGNA